MRVGIVLSGGGLRGAAHLGVLRRMVRHHIPIHVMVGVSAGAIIAAYYAAVGLSVHEMIEQAPEFRGRHPPANCGDAQCCGSVTGTTR